MSNSDCDIQSVQQKQPHQSRTNDSLHSIAAVHDYHSDPFTDRSTDDYAGDSSSLVSNESTRRATWLTSPLRIYIPPQFRDAVQSEGSIPERTARLARSAPMRPNATRIAAAEERLNSPSTTHINDATFVRFTIEQITRDPEVRRASISMYASSEDSDSVERVITGLATAEVPYELADPFQSRRARRAAAATQSYVASTITEDPPRQLTSGPVEVLMPVEPLLKSSRYPDLTFKPAVLRFPFILFMILFCLFMITSIMFCAIQRTLATFTGMDGSLYFVFRFLPQILGGIMIICLQAIMNAFSRILPFTMMASTSPERRTAGLFQDMFLLNFMIPRYDLFTNGYPLLGACYLWCWIIIIISVPLLSSLFSIVEYNEDVQWATVQGVAWTLVVLYFFLILGLSYVGLFFHGRITGLIWDPRSLADIIALLPRSNNLDKYIGTETSTRPQLRNLVGYQCNRLGYWNTDNAMQGTFYCIGDVGFDAHLKTGGQNFDAHLRTGGQGFGVMPPYPDQQRLGSNFQNFLDHPLTKHRERRFREKRAAELYNSAVRYRNGFPPDVSGAPNNEGFLPAIFLYSFVPSLIGIMMLLLFQALDLTLRCLQPWKELAAVDGSPARRSLLVEYSACSFFWQCTWSAFKNRHYRIAALSLLSALFILIPILAGGVFFPLITLPSITLLMFPNAPAFYIMFTLLILYLIGLFIPIANRNLMRLPHQVENLAEIISFLHNSPLLDDAAFRAPRSKADLVTRLTSSEPEMRFAFGWFVGRDGRETLGVDRIGRRGKPDLVVNREVLVSRPGRGVRCGRHMRLVCGSGDDG